MTRATLEDDELLLRAREFYDQTLRPVLEPAHIGEFVSIDVETGLYGVGRDPVVLGADLRARGARGPFALLRVGSAWTFDHLLR